MSSNSALDSCAQYYMMTLHYFVIGGVILNELTYYLMLKLKGEVFPSIVKKLLRHAVKSKNETLIRWLIKAGADVNACIYNKRTALQLLLEEKEEREEECSDKSLWFWRLFPWKNAVPTREMKLRVRIAQLLIENGADVSVPFYSVQTPYTWATLHSNRNRALIQLFLDHGADVNKKNENGKNVAQKYLADTTKTVLEMGRYGGIEPAFLRMIQPSESYTTPLHEACIFHRTVEIRNDTILLADEEINTEDTFGHTPLYYAVMSNGNPDAPEDKKSTINLLLRLGADINHKIIPEESIFDGDTMSILELAMLLKKDDIVQILLQHAAKLVDLENGEEKKALSESNLDFIRRMDSYSKERYRGYIEELKEIRMSKLLAEGQSSPSGCSIWLKKALEGISSVVNF